MGEVPREVAGVFLARKCGGCAGEAKKVIPVVRRTYMRTSSPNKLNNSRGIPCICIYFI